ncbi:MAG: hypothetical protein B7Z37_17370 [Verrucomicrobia bacterium 12-59-8]|nr:MAG: hypothetical protein B7Z37_17370 [Verrucomicrobia bacterium 12-59-8]
MGIAVHTQIVWEIGLKIQNTEQDEQPVTDDQRQEQREQKLVWEDGGLKEFEHVGRAGGDDMRYKQLTRGEAITILHNVFKASIRHRGLAADGIKNLLTTVSAMDFSFA